MLNFESFVNKIKTQKYNDKLISLCKNKDYDIIQVGSINDYQIFKLTINPEANDVICIVSGIHGNEPAGPLGILKFLENVYIPKNKKIVIIPLVNPTGYELNTRENEDKIDINREFFKKNMCYEAEILYRTLKKEKPKLLLTTHEDPGQNEFYVYYTDHKKISSNLIDLAKKYFKIYNKSDVLRGDKINNGLIPMPHIRRGGIEDVIYDLGIPYITTETPGKASLQKRIDCNSDIIKLVVQKF